MELAGRREGAQPHGLAAESGDPVRSRLRMAKGGDVLVSSTVMDLVAGSPFGFDDHGLQKVKRIPRQRQVWRVGAT